MGKRRCFTCRCHYKWDWYQTTAHNNNDYCSEDCDPAIKMPVLASVDFDKNERKMIGLLVRKRLKMVDSDNFKLREFYTNLMEKL